MIDARILLRAPLNFNGKCKVYPPSTNEVVFTDLFTQYQKMLTITQEEIEDEIFADKNSQGNPNLRIPTPFEFVLANSYQSKPFEQIARQAFEFFIHQPVHFLYEQKAILIGELEEELKKAKTVDDLILLTEEEFFDFQNLVRECLGNDPVELPDPNEDPRVKRIKAKARYRDKIKAKQGKGLQLGTIICAICCMGIGVTLLNIGEMSYASLGTIMKMYQDKEKYELDIKSLLAGADRKKIKPVYWIKN